MAPPIGAALSDGVPLRVSLCENDIRALEALEEELRFLFAERERDRGRTLWGRARGVIGL